MQAIYRPLGFQSLHNFVLFTILVGALMGFVLARFQFLNINTLIANTNPSDGVQYLRQPKRTGIMMHLGAILPAGFLACFQFVPVIRHKLLIFHRVNGYIITLLFLISNAGAFIKLPTSGGGEPSTVTILGLLGAGTTVTLGLAIYNIKRLRIDLHREWMIRTWVYAGSIISLRLISLAMVEVMKNNPTGPWYSVQSCSSIWAQHAMMGIPDADNPTPFKYPSCTSPTSQERVVVHFTADGPEGIATAINLSFGLGLWLSLALHAIGVEVYFRYTTEETERLRNVSRMKRIEAGLEKDIDDTASRGSSETNVAEDPEKRNKSSISRSAV